MLSVGALDGLPWQKPKLADWLTVQCRHMLHMECTEWKTIANCSSSLWANSQAPETLTGFKQAWPMQTTYCILCKSLSMLQAYAAKGVKKMYPWQAAALACGQNGSNLVYCAPTSGGKSLVAEILLIRRLVSTKPSGRPRAGVQVSLTVLALSANPNICMMSAW